MQIQFLWWEGCPSHPDAWQRLNAVLDELQVKVDIQRIEIQSEDDAMRWRFPGSPTILINGEDIDPQVPSAYRLTCRLYFHEDGRPSPLPSPEMIKRAVKKAQEE